MIDIKYLYFLDEQNNKLSSAYFDGYGFGDRLLEGVMFRATILENGTIIVTTKPEDAGYLEDLNMVKWMKEAHEVAKDDSTSFSNEHGQGEILLVTDENEDFYIKEYNLTE